MSSQAGSAQLLLNGLPPRTQITVDAHSETYVINERFSGIKSLPTGWHCISWSIPSSDSSTDQCASARPSEVSLRNVLLRWFDDGETAVRELDRLQQTLVVPDQLLSCSTAVSTSSSTRPKRYRKSRAMNASGVQTVSMLVTPEVLSAVEPRLLPYPEDAGHMWRQATRHLSLDRGGMGRQVVARVVGVEIASGDFTTDSLSTGPSRWNDAKEEEQLQRTTGALGRKEDGKLIWGKSRRLQAKTSEVEVQDDMENGVEDAVEHKSRKRSASIESIEGERDDGQLAFTRFELRRSWPANSIGAEITRWSQDKSWLLRDVARRSWLGISHSAYSADGDGWFVGLLCEFELAFVVFITANNAYAFEQWMDMVALFCRASSLIGAQSAFQLHPSTQISSPRTDRDIHLNAHIAFLNTLHTHVFILPTDFWSSQSTTQQESQLLKNLDILRANIARSLSTPCHYQHTVDEDQREQLVKAWRALSHTTSSRFGWSLDHRLDEEAEVYDDIEAEQGEDAPVVVDL
ncbi:uncharacterized protein UMAG_01163 [Mycosarcoma maydis]|uniref:A1 cistron-splicing factor AAR2 n=1 Tax=Mycosarcoma maydis TaxID=5270 RepID=A0A0D1CY26_MYCMD|nr:uncharacterized protein UMAG_01163 [Ustilago maydis 521]KIS71263.1 hypothetical protein UMAG_01163 [Ustilago maydis 521]|eukprot:XP_011387105.1 hypothetical protein UMAG_01163 [Ustilago maydis 521]